MRKGNFVPLSSDWVINSQVDWAFLCYIIVWLCKQNECVGTFLFI